MLLPDRKGKKEKEPFFMENYYGYEEKEPTGKYKPIGAWKYVGYNILFSIPLIGLIFLIVFACSSENINRRNYARSVFCAILLVVIIFAVVYGIMAIIGVDLMRELRYALR